MLWLIGRWWRVVVLAGVFSGLAGYVLVSGVQPTYESSAQLLVGPTNTDFDTLRASGELARTYAELATTRPVLESVAATVGLEGGAEALKPRVRAVASTVSRVITVSAQDKSRTRAQQVAAAIAGRLLTIEQQSSHEHAGAIDEVLRQPELRDLPVQVRDGVRSAAEAVLIPEAGRLTLVSPAQVPKDPSAPNVELITVLAALAGALSAAVITVLRDTFRNEVDTEDRLAALAAFPCLGSVTVARRWGRGSVPAAAMVRSPIGDRYRLLCAKLGLFHHPLKVRRLAALGAEGDSDAGGVAAGLGAVAAAAGLGVTLVDADTEQHQITTLFGYDRRPGYVELMTGGQETDAESLERVRISIAPNLDLVPAGAGDASGIDRGAVRSLLEQLVASGTDLVVVAVPPVSRSSTSFEWISSTDACLVVARRYQTPAAAVADTGQALLLAGAAVAGTVLVDDRKRVRAGAPPLPGDRSREPASPRL